MTEQESSTHRSLTQLCRRLLDIDPEHSKEKGCPAHYAAFPMIEAWVKSGEPVPQVISSMLGANGQDRACEIIEIQYLAQKYLTDSGG